MTANAEPSKNTRRARGRAMSEEKCAPLMVWDIYEQAVLLFGLNKEVADNCGEIVIRLSVGDIVRVQYTTHGMKKAKADE